MKKLAVSVLLFAACLGAADFWQSKPFTDWNDKDVKKMLDGSPWSKETNVAIGGSQGQGGGAGKRGSRTPGTMGEVASPDAPRPNAMGDSGPGGGRAGGGDKGGGDTSDGGAIPTMTLVVRWQSALPVKQAMARAKYGSEVTTSAEAKKLIETVEPNYIVVVSGLSRALLRGDPGSMKKEILNGCELLVKGKDPIKPVDFMVQSTGKGVDAFFAFPKTAAFSVEDKEVEFSAKFQAVTVKQRFQFKNMVLNGKLEL
jgi:hypothetical protein